jgi:hypothetical protein
MQFRTMLFSSSVVLAMTSSSDYITVIAIEVL